MSNLKTLFVMATACLLVSGWTIRREKKEVLRQLTNLESVVITERSRFMAMERRLQDPRANYRQELEDVEVLLEQYPSGYFDNIKKRLETLLGQARKEDTRESIDWLLLYVDGLVKMRQSLKDLIYRAKKRESRRAPAQKRRRRQKMKPEKASFAPVESRASQAAYLQAS